MADRPLPRADSLPRGAAVLGGYGYHSEPTAADQDRAWLALVSTPSFPRATGYVIEENRDGWPWAIVLYGPELH